MLLEIENSPLSKLQSLSNELLESFSAQEISRELERMLAVYIQYAPVDRLNLANAADLTLRITCFINTLEKELIKREVVLSVEQCIAQVAS